MLIEMFANVELQMYSLRFFLMTLGHQPLACSVRFCLKRQILRYEGSILFGMVVKN